MARSILPCPRGRSCSVAGMSPKAGLGVRLPERMGLAALGAAGLGACLLWGLAAGLPVALPFGKAVSRKLTLARGLCFPGSGFWVSRTWPDSEIQLWLWKLLRALPGGFDSEVLCSFGSPSQEPAPEIVGFLVDAPCPFRGAGPGASGDFRVSERPSCSWISESSWSPWLSGIWGRSPSRSGTGSAISPVRSSV